MCRIPIQSIQDYIYDKNQDHNYNDGDRNADAFPVSGLFLKQRNSSIIPIKRSQGKTLVVHKRFEYMPKSKFKLNCSAAHTHRFSAANVKCLQPRMHNRVVRLNKNTQLCVNPWDNSLANSNIITTLKKNRQSIL